MEAAEPPERWRGNERLSTVCRNRIEAASSCNRQAVPWLSNVSWQRIIEFRHEGTLVSLRDKMAEAVELAAADLAIHRSSRYGWLYLLQDIRAAAAASEPT
jgi:hypothetical protein